MPQQYWTSTVQELSEFRKKFTNEQMRRCHDLTVPDADDGSGMLAVGVEQHPVLVRCDERLVRKREHGRGAVGEMLDRGAERAAHAAGEIDVEGMPDGETFQRRQRRFIFAPQHHEDIVEAGVQDVAHRSTEERLVAKREQELLDAHPRRRARGEYYCADHERC